MFLINFYDNSTIKHCENIKINLFSFHNTVSKPYREQALVSRESAIH